MEPTFWRHWWWNGGYFGSIYQIKALLPVAITKKQEMMNNLAAGTVGGFVGTVINTPCKCLKQFVADDQSMSQSRVFSCTRPASGPTPALSASHVKRALARSTRVLHQKSFVWLQVVVSCFSVSLSPLFRLTSSCRGPVHSLPSATWSPLHLDALEYGMQIWERPVTLTVSGPLRAMGSP